MDLDVQSIGFAADQKLIDFISEKADKLTTYYDRIVFSEVYLRVDRKSAQENKIAEIKIGIPGNDDAIRSIELLTKVIADAAAEGMVARHSSGEQEAEPLAEWERELLAQPDTPAEQTETVSATETGDAPVAEAEDKPEAKKAPAKKPAAKKPAADKTEEKPAAKKAPAKKPAASKTAAKSTKEKKEAE